MPAIVKTISTEFNVYIPKDTNNPYIRNAVNYSDGLSSSSLEKGTGVSLVTTLINGITLDEEWNDFPGEVDTMFYKPLTAELSYATQHLVFTVTFTCNESYHFDSGGASLIKRKIIENAPRNSSVETTIAKDIEFDKDDNYTNRWKFIEYVKERNTNQMATKVVLKGYYTTPDYRCDDATQPRHATSAIVTSSSLERAKNRGVILIPMVRANALPRTTKINHFSIFDGREGYDGNNTLIYHPPSKTATMIQVKGTPGATGVVVGVQETGVGFKVNEPFVIPDSGITNVKVEIPAVEVIDSTCDYNNDPTIAMDDTSKVLAGMSVSGTGIPVGATVSSVTNNTSFELSTSTTGGAVTNGTLKFDYNDEFKFYVVTGNETSGSVPTREHPFSIFKFRAINVTLQFTQTGSDFVIKKTGTSTVISTAKDIISKATAFSRFNRGAKEAVAPASTDLGTGRTARHRRITKKRQDERSLYAFNVTVTPSGSDVTIDPKILHGATDGSEGVYPKDYVVNNVKSKDNGGSKIHVQDLFLRETSVAEDGSAANVDITGYIAVEQLGKDDVAIEIPIDELLNNS